MYLSICLSVYLSIYLSLSLFISLSLSLSISLYLSLYLSLSISIYIYLYLYLSLSISISIYLCLSLSISIYLYLNLSLSISIYLYLSLSLSISIYLPIITYLPISLSTYLPIYLSIYLSIDPSSNQHNFYALLREGWGNLQTTRKTTTLGCTPCFGLMESPFRQVGASSIGALTFFASMSKLLQNHTFRKHAVGANHPTFWLKVDPILDWPILWLNKSPPHYAATSPRDFGATC